MLLCAWYERSNYPFLLQIHLGHIFDEEMFLTPELLKLTMLIERLTDYFNFNFDLCSIDLIFHEEGSMIFICCSIFVKFQILDWYVPDQLLLKQKGAVIKLSYF